MGMIASQITSLTIVHSTVYSVTDQRKHQSSASQSRIPLALWKIYILFHIIVYSFYIHEFKWIRPIHYWHTAISKFNLKNPMSMSWVGPKVKIIVGPITNWSIHIPFIPCNWTTHSWDMAWAPFYYHGLTSIPAWISNYTHYNVWDEITYPFLNFNGATVEV